MTTLEDAPTASSEIGNDRRRKEDQRLITGRTRWTDNLAVPGMLHMAIVRSPHAHARINSIDMEAADRATNIYDVFDGKKLQESMGVMINA
jgi:carbon-monoxide dehydrogenase large subunit